MGAASLVVRFERAWSIRPITISYSITVNKFLYSFSLIGMSKIQQNRFGKMISAYGLDEPSANSADTGSSSALSMPSSMNESMESMNADRFCLKQVSLSGGRGGVLPLLDEKDLCCSDECFFSCSCISRKTFKGVLHP